MSDRMMFVAEDPKQPGAAFAGCIDDPKYLNENVEAMAEWRGQGANILRVDAETGKDMMMRWRHPSF